MAFFIYSAFVFLYIGSGGSFVLAVPVAALAAAGVGAVSHVKNKKLKDEKIRLYKEALKKHNAIIKALKNEANAGKERIEYLQSLNILLQQAVKDLRKDLGISESGSPDRVRAVSR